MSLGNAWSSACSAVKNGYDKVKGFVVDNAKAVVVGSGISGASMTPSVQAAQVLDTANQTAMTNHIADVTADVTLLGGYGLQVALLVLGFVIVLSLVKRFKS